MKRYCNSQHRSRGCGLILLLLATAATNCNCFGVSSTGKQAHSFRLAAVALPDISDVLNGESCVDAETEKFFDGTTPISLEGEAVVSSFAPQLTYEKYLTMQSKRVPVLVRYSAESGLKPYFLTVAKKIKEAYPDVKFDKVVIPKVQLNENSKGNELVTFEVMVDGKMVVRTPGRKGSFGSENMHVYVNMQEVEGAIIRARKRRRPQTVYGEDTSNARLELLKNKSQKKSAE